MFDQNQPEEQLRYKKPTRHRYSVREKFWTRKNRGGLKKKLGNGKKCSIIHVVIVDE
jgi:hypothetical protein